LQDKNQGVAKLSRGTAPCLSVQGPAPFRISRRSRTIRLRFEVRMQSKMPEVRTADVIRPQEEQGKMMLILLKLPRNKFLHQNQHLIAK